jgi:GNAT superfamily N-acetyltransferase
VIATRPIDLSAAGLERSAAMLRAAMPHAGHFTAAYLEWLYVKNPAGHALGLEAFDGEQLVCHCVVQPLRARLHGVEVRGVMSLNAATLPGYLGRGLYFGLAEQLYAQAKEQGFAFGVAVTNDKSTPGFVRRCGFEVVQPLDARLGIGPHPMPNAEAVMDFEKLWDEEAVAWRLSPPHVRYRYESAEHSTRVFAPSGRPGVEVELGSISTRMLPKIPPTPRRPISPLRLWVGLDPTIDWTRTAYWNLPMRIRPSPLNLIFSDLTRKGIRLDARSVRWRGVDFDDF